MAIITRYLSEGPGGSVERVKTELDFLRKYLKHDRLRGDLALEFRGPSELSVYYRGLRMAQVRFRRAGGYRVTTHKSFIKKTPLRQDQKEPPFRAEPVGEDYVKFDVGSDSIHALLQMKHILAMRTQIKKVPLREEIGVSHVIAADNMKGTGVVVIDREVGDSAPEHPGERLDLLALQAVGGGEYRFLAIEVKLGNNPELDLDARERAGARSAVEQVEGYAAHIEQYFDEYADCYRKNISQKLELELLDNWPVVPTIVRGTRPLLVVAGYSRIAGPRLDEIEHKHQRLWVKTFGYELESRDGRILGLRSTPDRSDV